MNTEKLDALAGSVAEGIKGWVRKSLASITSRFDDVEKRISEIPAGPQGVPGIDGKNGDPGPVGEKGLPGDMGPMGLQGAEGPTGPQGETGPHGEIGPQGPAGENGSNGADGAQGEKGDAGEIGPVGPQGDAGSDGAVGPQGDKGERGEMGPAGPAGPQGEAGTDGRDGLAGKEGTPGRDAIEIDVRDGIDETRSYPRATYATYDGGLVRSIRITDPLEGKSLLEAGWAVVLDGFKSVSKDESEDGRTVTFKAVMTSGKSHEWEVTSKSMIYRQTYSADKEYQPGDVVTWGGSMWHCEKATKAKPGESPDWKLAVKKGSDGRDFDDPKKKDTPIKLK